MAVRRRVLVPLESLLTNNCLVLVVAQQTKKPLKRKRNWMKQRMTTEMMTTKMLVSGGFIEFGNA